MPELPEVETIRLGLQNKIVGKKITDLEILSSKIFQGDKKEVIGSKVTGIRRRSKILIIDLDSNFSLVIHLKLTGQLVYQGKERATFGHPIPYAGTILPAKTTKLIFTFDDQSKLFFNDMRGFAYLKVIKTEEVENLKAIKEFGPEPFTSEFTLEKFKEILEKRGKPIKLVLMDQTLIAGVGNIYASEALFLAKIDPRKKANSLNSKEIEKLYKAVLEVLKMGLKYGGASDNTYVNVSGGQGKMQEHFKVYGKAGKPCPCGGVIKRVSLGSRGTYFCPSCQK
ncbi:MAG: bifunctional DNA-formamidopyrimidine glycosylase/DNA-(apurinic or apyrimidinic site) lyase [Candidatus Daviesbacteria bacterium]